MSSLLKSGFCAWRERKKTSKTQQGNNMSWHNLPMVWLYVGHQARGSCISLHTGGLTLLPPRHHAKLEAGEPSAPSFPCPLTQGQLDAFPGPKHQNITTDSSSPTCPSNQKYYQSLKQVEKCPAKFLSFPEGPLWCFLFEISNICYLQKKNSPFSVFLNCHWNMFMKA